MKKIIALLLMSLSLTAQSKLNSVHIPPELMEQYYISKSMGFATTKNTTEVYFFTDWKSEPSRNLETTIKAMTPELLKQARIYFLDPQTTDLQNINKANLISLLNPQKQLETYFKVRAAFYALAQKSPKPTEEEVKAALLAIGFNYAPSLTPEQQKGFDKAAAINARLLSNLHLKEAPAAVIVSSETQKQKTLTGAAAISQANILNAIAEVNIPEPEEEEEEEEEEEVKPKPAS